MELETNICIGSDEYEVELPVMVEYEISGKYYPATLTDPEEHPDMEVQSIKLHPDLIPLLKKALGEEWDGVFDADDLADECWNHAQEQVEGDE